MFLIEYLKISYGPGNVTCEDDYVNVEDLDCFKEAKVNETVGGNLKFYRTRDNLTQAELAEELCTTISRTERGTRPISKKTAKRLASIFKTSPSSFI